MAVATTRPLTMPTVVHPASWIQKTSGVVGGDACVRNTRIAVWMLIECKQAGMTDEQIRQGYDPPLTQEDMTVAWEYYRLHKEEIEAAWGENEKA